MKKKDKKNEKKKLIIGIAMMVFAVAISVGTYAYYQTTITGTVNVTMLAWDCTNENAQTSAGVSLGDLAPGSSGSFTFAVKSTNFVTDIEIKMNYQNAANKPANFGLYSDSGHNTPITLSGTSLTDTTVFTHTGVAKNTTTSDTVYWYWSNDAAEQPLSTTTDLTLQINYTIICKQAAGAQG